MEKMTERSAVRVDLSFNDMPVKQALDSIGMRAGVAVHYTPPAAGDGTVTLNLKGIPASEAFAYVASFANLAISYKDDGVYFAPRG
jgi:hypothetical protein